LKSLRHTRKSLIKKTLLSWTNGFIVTILIVVLMSFITFLLDSWKFHSEKIEEYNNLVKSFNNQKDSIKYNNLEMRILSLENKKR
jgi:di/tricarboxylate transporter